MSGTNEYKLQLKSFIKTLPPNPKCGDFHHSKKERHCMAERCPPLDRFIEELMKSIKIVSKGE